MARLQFGVEEKVTCIEDVALPGPEQESLCLAFKTTTHHFIGGLYLEDDGYVLKVKTQNRYYPLPQGEELASLQQQKLLPAPIPKYEIPTAQYVFAYSLWWVIALTILFLWGTRAIKKHRMGKFDPYAPIDYGPPRIEKPADQFILDEASKMLEHGEHVQHQAYGTDRRMEGVLSSARANGSFAVLTNRRLIFIETEVGAFKPVLKNKQTETIATRDIQSVRLDDEMLVFQLADGSTRTLVVELSQKHFTNQLAFLHNVPRIFGYGQTAAFAT